MSGLELVLGLVSGLGFNIDAGLSLGLLVPNPWLNNIRLFWGEDIWYSS